MRAIRVALNVSGVGKSRSAVLRGAWRWIKEESLKGSGEGLWFSRKLFTTKSQKCQGVGCFLLAGIG